MEMTQPVDWIEQPFEGYVMNSIFSPENTDAVMDLISAIDGKFGDSVFCMPRGSLHITLLDWIAPLVDYDGKDKQALFEAIYDQYDKVFEDIFASTKKINITFDKINVAPSTIYLTGHDDGQIQEIRNKFLESVDLLPGTKQPPTIIHSSIARFRRPVELSAVEDFVATKSLSFTQEIDCFRLVHTTKEPMLEFEVLKEYLLQ